MSASDAIEGRFKPGSDTGNVIATLDRWGFSVADHRISLWTALVAVIVIVGVYVFAKVLTRLVGLTLGKLTHLDSTQKLLAEKLISIAVWALAIIVGIDILGINLPDLTVF